MRKLIWKFILLILLMLGGILLVIVCQMAFYGYVLNREFQMGNGQEVLFMGSSQTGCAIVQTREYRNKVIFSSERPMESILSRIRYMDEKGCLDKVKILVVRLNQIAIKMETPDRLLRAWFQELPISWNRVLDYKQSYFSAISYLLSHLRIPTGWGFNECRPLGRKPISLQSDEWKMNFYSIIKEEVNDYGCLSPSWSDSFVAIYKRLKDICDSRKIRLVVVEYPCLKGYCSWINEENRRKYLRVKEEVRKFGIEVVEFGDDFGEEYFFDEAHMTNDGAEVFTRKLFDRLKSNKRICK